jgi:hypothetical protein
MLVNNGNKNICSSTFFVDLFSPSFVEMPYCAWKNVKIIKVLFLSA